MSILAEEEKDSKKKTPLETEAFWINWVALQEKWLMSTNDVE